MNDNHKKSPSKSDSDAVNTPTTTAAQINESDLPTANHNDYNNHSNNSNNNSTDNNGDTTMIPPMMKTTLIAKYGKETITIPDLPSESTTIATVKNMILEQTNILPKRQKFVGLAMMMEDTTTTSSTTSSSSTTNTSTSSATAKRRKKAIDNDECTLDKLYIKKPKECIYDPNGTLLHSFHSFLLMGTPESEIFLDPDIMGNNVVNDFDLDFNIGSLEWKEHFVNHQNLVKFTNSTEVHIMNPPREGKKLMVLDLDHTLLDFSSKKIVNSANAVRNTVDGNGNDGSSGSNSVSGSGNAEDGGVSSSQAAVAPFLTVQETINQMKRPYMDQFLAEMYQYYDLVVWSQTSWRWLETKLVELGMLTNPNYRFCFVLDKTSMFAITSTKRNGQKIKHYVKPLEIIWAKFPNVWDATNTIHLDDLSRNFALNISNGLKVTAYYRKKRKGSGRRNISTGNKDVELIGLIGYCAKLAKEVKDFRDVEFKYWKDVVNGTKDLSVVTKKDG